MAAHARVAPGSGRETRRKLGESARRAGAAAAKLRGGREPAGNGDWSGSERQVRSVQELGRDESDVF